MSSDMNNRSINNRLDNSIAPWQYQVPLSLEGKRYSAILLNEYLERDNAAPTSIDAKDSYILSVLIVNRTFWDHFASQTSNAA